MRSDTTAAKLLAVPARLESRSVDAESFATGFIYEVRATGGRTRTFLVANRHHFECAADGLLIRLVQRDASGCPAWGNELCLEVGDANPPWFAHPTPSIDIGVMPLDSILSPGRLFAVNSDAAMTLTQEQRFDAIEEVLTVGFPNGLVDARNLTPIVRGGVTATPVGLDYEGEPAFVIDAATFPGSSGSPVFVLARNPASLSGRHEVLGRRVVLAGVISALHARRARGDVGRVAARDALEFSVNQPMHLAVVLKARVIDETVDRALAAEGLARSVGAAVPLRPG